MSTTAPPPDPPTRPVEIPPPSDWTEAAKVDKHQNPWAVMLEYIKMIIPLASAILGVTVTFLNTLAGAVPTAATIHLIETAWLFLIVTIASALFAVGIITGYLRGKPKKMWQASLLCNIAYFALGLALILFACAGASRLSQMSNSNRPHPQPVSYFRRLGKVGPFDSGLANLCREDTPAHECNARVEAALEPLGIAQLPGKPTLFFLIGSADRERLSRSALRKFGSNAGLARGRSEWVRTELLKRFPDAMQNAQFISLYTGPNPLQNTTYARSEQDRYVEVWAVSLSGGKARP